MSPITTHILDIAAGRPAANVPVRLEIKEESGWKSIGEGRTDTDGRVKTLLPDDHALAEGTYRITFDTGAYFAESGVEGFYPEAGSSLCREC